MLFPSKLFTFSPSVKPGRPGTPPPPERADVDAAMTAEEREERKFMA